MVAPSDMMDGRVEAIKEALLANGFGNRVREEWEGHKEIRRGLGPAPPPPYISARVTEPSAGRGLGDPY